MEVTYTNQECLQNLWHRPLLNVSYLPIHVLKISLLETPKVWLNIRLSFARAKAARKRRAKELKLARPSGDRKTTRLRPTRAPTESSRNYTRSTEKCHFKMTVKHDTNHMTHSTKTHKSQLWPTQYIQ